MFLDLSVATLAFHTAMATGSLQPQQMVRPLHLHHHMQRMARHPTLKSSPVHRQKYGRNLR